MNKKASILYIYIYFWLKHLFDIFKFSIRYKFMSVILLVLCHSFVCVFFFEIFFRLSFCWQILLLTGTESTAVTLTWTLSLLLNNPKALKAAQEEMDTHVGRNRWVDESDIPKLHYLQAVLKESLRVNPTGPVTGPREAMEDCYIANQFVPKGTRLTVNIWKLHRDPRIWSDPCEFRPERFLTTHADVGFKGQNFEYMPFSLGRRSCPATTLGLTVVQSVLARLIQGFDMRTKDGEPVDMSEGLGIALPKATPLEAVLSPRLPLELYESL